ncbi:MAG: flagellar biosynthetic protein FliO [Pseudomonadota bacterium]|nr:flagellar biosynthetic protein FliO [Pseudomonadota bacterium]
MMVPDQEGLSWVRLVIAFAVMFALLVSLAFGLKYVKTKGMILPGMTARGQQRLKVVETLPLDLRRRLILIRCDDKEHLLLLGHDQDILLDTTGKENHPP